MEVNFNNLRKKTCFAYDRLASKLNAAIKHYEYKHFKQPQMNARERKQQQPIQPTIAGEACVSGSTLFLKDLFNVPREMRDFIADYIDTVNTFNFNVSTYRGAKDDLGIQNMDLWIESYIEIIPELQEFRNFVRSEMKRLDIPKFPDYVYDKKINHFFYTNTIKLEKLSTLLDKPFKST